MIIIEIILAILFGLALLALMFMIGMLIGMGLE